LAGAHHDLASYYLSIGNRRCAMQHHLRALSLIPAGLRYLLYTRYLCLPSRLRSGSSPIRPEKPTRGRLEICDQQDALSARM
jgi:hypothetical protein